MFPVMLICKKVGTLVYFTNDCNDISILKVNVNTKISINQFSAMSAVEIIILQYTIFRF